MTFRRYLGFLFALQVLTLISCASKPKLTGRAELCGYVVDENNYPVEEFIVSCRSELGVWKTTITNQKGFFMFENMDLGNCFFKGQKNGFVKLEKNMEIFGDKSKVVCFQVSSLDRALDSVEEKILCEDFESAKALLNQIVYMKKSPAESVILCYKTYVDKQIKEKKKNEKKGNV